MELNIEKEKKLIDLLGYKLKGPDNSNRWIIIKGNQEVGYIQFKKLKNGNKAKNISKIYGYKTVINSDDILYEELREANDSKGNIKEENYYYLFYIKHDEEKDAVECCLSNDTYITIWSSEYGFISFYVDYGGLYLNYHSKTDNFNIEEVVAYKNSHDKATKKYIYQIKYSNRLSDNTSDKRVTIREISGVQNASIGENKVLIKETSEKRLKNRKTSTKEEHVVEGDIEKLVYSHEMGIDSFNHFRWIINRILPFKKEVLESLVDEKKIEDLGLSIFFNQKEKEVVLKKEKR